MAENRIRFGSQSISEHYLVKSGIFHELTGTSQGHNRDITGTSYGPYKDFFLMKSGGGP